MSTWIAVGAIRFALGLNNSCNARRIAERVILGALPLSSPARPGPLSLAVVPAPGSPTPASPGRRGDGTHATIGPRSGPGPAPASSAGSLAPPAGGPSPAARRGAGACPQAGR